MFDKNANRCCAYCLHAEDFYEDIVLCDKNGPVSADGVCRRFVYDPLRRVPNQPHVKGKKVDPGEFEIK